MSKLLLSNCSYSFHFSFHDHHLPPSLICDGEANKVSTVLKRRCQIWMKMDVLIKASYNELPFFAYLYARLPVRSPLCYIHARPHACPTLAYTTPCLLKPSYGSSPSQITPHYHVLSFSRWSLLATIPIAFSWFFHFPSLFLAYTEDVEQ